MYKEKINHVYYILAENIQTFLDRFTIQLLKNDSKINLV